MPLDKKRSRGRISLRKKALQRDPIIEATTSRALQEKNNLELYEIINSCSMCLFINNWHK